MEAQKRKLSIPLIIGIIFIPIIFAWFTLKKGYSKKARVFSLGYLFLTFLLFVVIPDSAQRKQINLEEKNTQETAVQERLPKAEVASEPKVSAQQPKAEVKQSTVIASEPVIAKEPIKVEEVKPTPKVEQPKIGQTGLKITPEQFLKKYNQEATEQGTKTLRGLKYLNGGKIVKFDLNNDFYIAGQVDKDKNLEKVMVGLVLLKKNLNKAEEQSFNLLDMGQNALAALDNNKSDMRRDNIVRDIHSDLFNDPETAKGNNSKVASYNQVEMSIAYVAEVSSIAFTFQPRN